MSVISMAIGFIVNLPHFLVLIIIDFVQWIINKGWKDFNYWGLHLFVGSFGSGKTSFMVSKALKMAKKFPNMTILCNFQLYNFPNPERIIKLKSMKQITDCPPETLIMIDEIGTLFNSRDFTTSKESVPKILFRHICQCRKMKKVMFGTTQKYNFLDKQLRDICDTVTTCSLFMPHPFSRMWFNYKYDADEYEIGKANPMITIPCRGVTVSILTDKIRNSYDTTELIDDLMKMDYIEPTDILPLTNVVVDNADKKSRNKILKNLRRL